MDPICCAHCPADAVGYDKNGEPTCSGASGMFSEVCPPAVRTLDEGPKAPAPAPTPGYNVRLSVAFTCDKHGKPIAYYWSGERFGRGRMSPPGTIGRWLRMGFDKAKLLVAQEQAEQVAYSRWGDPAPAPDAN